MSDDRAASLWCEFGWLGGERAETGVLIELDGERIGSIDTGVTEAPAEAIKLKPAERDIATRAARAFRLGLAGVDMLRSANGPKILEVNSSPGFEGIEGATGRNIAGLVYEEIENRVRPAPARRKKG